jgi:hypothetical protein
VNHTQHAATQQELTGFPPAAVVDVRTLFGPHPPYGEKDAPEKKRPCDMTEKELDDYASKGFAWQVSEIRKERMRMAQDARRSADFVLGEAQSIVYGAREGQYGHPSKNFEDIAHGWSRIAGIELNVGQVGLMMVWLKVMRAKRGLQGYSGELMPARESLQDSFVDIAGYAEATMRALYEEPEL